MRVLRLELRQEDGVEGVNCVAVDVRPAEYPDGVFGAANGPLGALASLLFLLEKRQHSVATHFRRQMLPVWIDGQRRWVEGVGNVQE